MVIIKKTKIPKSGDVKEKKLLYPVSENVNEYNHYEKVWIFLKNIENRTTIWFNRPTIGIIFKGHKISTSKRYLHVHNYFNIRLSEVGKAQEDKMCSHSCKILENMYQNTLRIFIKENTYEILKEYMHLYEGIILK